MKASQFNRERAILNLGNEARKRVIKNEVMKFRLEAKNLARLLKWAQKMDKPAGTMVREWVNEKLDELDNTDGKSPQTMAIGIIASSLASRGLLPNAQIGQINQLLAQKRHR